MVTLFPEIIRKLPQADISIDGVIGYISQSDTHQIMFLSFKKDTIIPTHSHDSQWEIVLAGKVDVEVNDKKQTYKKGDHFYVEKNVPHSAYVYSGYHAIAFFNQHDRYKKK